MANENSKLIAKIILKNNLATRQQVVECMQQADKLRVQGESPRLTDLLLNKNYLDQRQVTAVLDAYYTTSRILSLNQSITGYQFIKEVGNGTAGTVYLAKQKSIGREVAIKVLDEDLASDPKFIEKFQREAKAAARINHPNVIQAIDVDEADGIYFFVTEFVDGETLQSLLRRDRYLDEARAADFILQLTKALRHVDKLKLIHRDIKPGNILINGQGQAKLCDLGLARLMDAATAASSSTGAAGTPAYMSPEQAMGNLSLDIRSDLFSLGASYYHSLAGRIPFLATNLPDMLKKLVGGELDPIRSLRPDVSEETARIIHKMMATDREERPGSPAELEAMLVDLVKSLPQAPPLHLVKPSGECFLPPQGKRPSSSFEVPVVVVTSGREKDERHYLTRNRMVVGRQSASDIRVRDHWISRSHLAFVQERGKVRIEALSKSNVTLLNGKEVQTAELSPGDEISIHKTHLRFELEEVPTS